MDETIFDKIKEVDLRKTMETSYIDYAMSVIASRALPDVRDGLKPVQRRILYAMIELNNGPDKPHRKCARIVGDTMGKYHPHGDSSIYGALVNMAQDWNMRYPLVDGHGNFGSVDGDGAAAMRYTEARLSKMSMEMLADIGKDTVDFVPNFDETEKEPMVLPSRFPNLLVNGTSGIAVGMATNIPPHNLREVVDGVVKIIDNRVLENRDTTIDEVLSIIKGPDFPTGAVILGKAGINEAYRTGRGKIRVRAVTEIEPMANGKNRIVVTELPYLVNKARLIEKIADLVKEKKIDGITLLQDESNRHGMRICIELRRDVNATVVLNQLYKHTQLQDTFGVTMLALVNNEPKVLNLLQMLTYYLKHQEEVVTRRTRYDLNKAQERAHILEGLLIALDHIDRVIQIVRGSKNGAEAKILLMEEFDLSDAQSQAIIDMRLRTLTGLERERLEQEYKDLMEKIAYYQGILSDENKLLGVIKEELLAISAKYGDDRRTTISRDTYDLEDIDLIPTENVIIAMTKRGYIKRMPVDQFKAQNRGGKGIKGMQTIDDDFIEELLMPTTHHNLMFFTNQGRAYKMKAYEIPEASRNSRGTAIVNLLSLQPEEKVTAIIPIRDQVESKYLFMATKQGFVKRTPMQYFANMRSSGLLAISLREGDELIGVKPMDDEREILLITKQGMCTRFPGKDVRPQGRSAMGVRGIRLRQDDEVIGMQLVGQGECLLFVTEGGLGKRTKVSDFPIHHRGGKGILCYRVTEKTGPLVDVKSVDEGQEVLLMSTAGILIRTKVDQISVLGRNASGVKVMEVSPEENIVVASMTKVRETIEDMSPENVCDEEDAFEEAESYEEDIEESEDSYKDEGSYEED